MTKTNFENLQVYQLSKNNRPTAKDVFDLSKVLEVVDGDMELFEEIARLFLENLPDSIAQIEALSTALEQGDAEGLRRQAYTLKDAAANLSDNKVAAATLRLEQIGREGDLSVGKEALA